MGAQDSAHTAPPEQVARNPRLKRSEKQNYQFRNQNKEGVSLFNTYFDICLVTPVLSTGLPHIRYKNELTFL